MSCNHTASVLLAVALAACAEKSPSSDLTDPGPNTTTPDPTTTDSQVWDPRFDAFVDALLDDLDASHAPAVSAAVIEHGEVVFAAAFGKVHPDKRAEVTRDTLFQIGSTTKMMAATALLQKVEEGLVDPGDLVSAHLDQLYFDLDPSWGDQITIHHLLSHQGAFYDTVPWTQGPDDTLLESYTYDVFDDTIWLMAPPGSFWNYSNPNFSLAGLVTQVHDDRMWPDLLVEDVLLPLGMDRSYTRKAAVEADGDYSIGVGYPDADDPTPEITTVEMDAVTDPGWVRPAGLVWSTPAQMVRFADFVMHGNPEVLRDDLRRELITPQVSMADGAGGSYGYGVMVYPGFTIGDEHWVVPVYTHGGNTLSHSSELWMLPDQDLAFSILSSGYGTDFSHSVGTALTTLPEGLPAPVPAPELPFEPAGLDRHVGDYFDEYNVGGMFVTREGNALMVEMPLLEEAGIDVDPNLIPLTTDIHLIGLDGTYYDLTFLPDPADPDPEVSTYAKNRAFVVTRITDEEQRLAPPTPPRIDRDELLRRLARSRLE